MLQSELITEQGVPWQLHQAVAMNMDREAQGARAWRGERSESCSEFAVTRGQASRPLTLAYLSQARMKACCTPECKDWWATGCTDLAGVLRSSRH